MSRAFNADIEYRESCQKFLESLIARCDFRGAARYYDSIAESLSGQVDTTTGIIIRLGAKAFGSSGDLPRALTLVRTAITILSRADVETSQLAEGYLDLAEILRELGNLPEAMKAFRDAESIFRRNDNFSRAGDALNRLGGVHFRKGEFNASLSCLLEALEYARGEKDSRKLAYLYGNIGRVYTFLGKLSEARDNLQFNISLSKNFNDDKELARAYLSLGYIQTQLADFEKAEESFAEAIEYIKKTNLEKEEIIYLTYSGELLQRMGQYDGAEWRLKESASRAARLAPESFLAGRPLRHLAEVLVKRRQYRKALKAANRALAIMKKIDNQVEIGALYKIQAICHSHLKDESRGLEYFGRALAILEERRARFELAETLAEAGRTALYPPGQRLMYLCRAEEIYSACGIKALALQMQKYIGTLSVSVKCDSGQASAENVNGDFPTRNTKMKQIAAQLKLLRDSDLPILLSGETGTGKDFMARYFHAIARPEAPYIAINCAAVPETLIESELFGYRKGAFTGAETNRDGLFAAANGGVVLLDEIGELPLTLQAKLLSVLETRKLRPLGTAREIKLDIILLAATNRNLADMVEDGTFRRDLYYRLAGMTFHLPPLRERKEDIPYLLGLFMKQFGLLKEGQKPESELVSMFVSYDWPGNIRQMENKIKQLSVMASLAQDGSIVELSRPIFEKHLVDKGDSLFEQVEKYEKSLLVEALVAAGGNKSEAARMLSIHESTFRAKMKKYGLELAAG